MRLMRSMPMLLTTLWCTSAYTMDGRWHPGGTVAWTSDYVFRGVSQSDNRPALQGELHIEPAPQWTVGAWASSVRLVPDHRSTELDFYINKQWTMGQDLGMELSVVRYSYRNDPRPVSYTYDELSWSINWLDAWSLSVSWSPDTSLIAYSYGLKTHQQTATLETGYHLALPYRFELAFGAGYFAPLEQHEGGYGFGNAGVSRRFGSLRAELNWFWTQDLRHRTYTTGPAGGPWALTVMWGF